MAEVWRKEEPLRTADLAGTRTGSATEMGRESGEYPADGGPRLVQNEPRSDTRNEAVAGGMNRDENAAAPSTNQLRDTNHELPGSATSTPLLSDVELTDLRSRWTDIQAGFVDEPRRSVEQADQLVATAIQRIAERFAKERSSLETQWESGKNVSTEDLRVALQQYRAFFGRLLNAA